MALENQQSIVIIPDESSSQVTVGTNLLLGQVYIKPVMPPYCSYAY
ncbi:hypothetical protein [Rickettsia sp. TH2014]|nr:hypothetical protein [Rickettsia sp. TH2014]